MYTIHVQMYTEVLQNALMYTYRECAFWLLAIQKYSDIILLHIVAYHCYCLTCALVSMSFFNGRKSLHLNHFTIL